MLMGVKSWWLRLVIILKCAFISNLIMRIISEKSRLTFYKIPDLYFSIPSRSLKTRQVEKVLEPRV